VAAFVALGTAGLVGVGEGIAVAGAPAVGVAASRADATVAVASDVGPAGVIGVVVGAEVGAVIEGVGVALVTAGAAGVPERVARGAVDA
jgi:hypothetical protein